MTRPFSSLLLLLFGSLWPQLLSWGQCVEAGCWLSLPWMGGVGKGLSIPGGKGKTVKRPVAG